uniref:Uncharacterized protein n=1 Tax=Desulfobacca acetoxidans TaxID=60893 RepID=A0A7V4G7Z7_9BACT
MVGEAETAATERPITAAEAGSHCGDVDTLLRPKSHGTFARLLLADDGDCLDALDRHEQLIEHIRIPADEAVAGMILQIHIADQKAAAIMRLRAGKELAEQLPRS